MFLFKNHSYDSFFDDINGKKLDKYQRKVILDESQNLLVVAGAGSGKTLTILGKVKYLIEKKGYSEREILCLSFTNETVNNLKNKLDYSVDVLTFHKLGLSILQKSNFKYSISSDTLLEYVTDEYFYSFVNKNDLESYFENKYLYEEILNSDELIVLKRNILSFIKKIKCNDLKIKDLERIKRKCFRIQDKLFLLFSLSVFSIYQEELLSTLKIDFDDMIIYAKDLVSKIHFPYRYIIIDEYQDISFVRFSLICEILQKTNAKLMCVGDDYQAIYGFSGSSVSLFIDFFKYFQKAKRIDIKNTYRNSYELIKTSVNFIKKNPCQLKKDIHATFLYKNPIVLVYYDNNYLEMYQNVLNYLYLEDEKEVMVLARYNKNLDEVKEKNTKGIMVRYLTCHMAKGLESDNVILLKMSDDYLGFPSKIKNNEIIEMIDNDWENIDYAEERRLFYVALTRCRKRIYILVPKHNPSSFIEEIKNDCAILLLK